MVNQATGLLFCHKDLASQNQGIHCKLVTFETFIVLYKTAYCRRKQWRVGGAWAAEESVLRDQVLICIYCVLHVLLADQSAEQFIVCWTWQGHALIALEDRIRFVCLFSQTKER